jgi:hypothetical protein
VAVVAMEIDDDDDDDDARTRSSPIGVRRS